MNKYWLFIISLALCTAISCKKKTAIDRFNESVLFAAPADSEISSVLLDWRNRDLTTTNNTIVSEQRIAGRFTLKIISYQLQHIIEYGAIVVPDGANTLPVRIWVGGFGLEETNNSVILAFDSSSAIPAAIVAIPALRGQYLTLTIDGTTYTTPVSGGRHCDAFDEATDDVLAFMNVIDALDPKADLNRTSVRGGSRGATVAMLAGIRDTRVKRVVSVAGPNELLLATKEHKHDPTYQCQFLDGLISGQTTIADTRRKMIASSPLYFAQYLPPTQVHMGRHDDIVPISQGYTLRDQMTRLGKSLNLELYEYDRTHSDIATNNAELNKRIELFLSQL